MGERAIKRKCERLFMAAAPYVRAEHEAEEALVAARFALRKARKAAAVTRAMWVDFILQHEHQTTCQAACPDPRAAEGED